MSPRFVLCLLLCCASAPLMAHDVQRLAPDSGGGHAVYPDSEADAVRASRPAAKSAAARTARSPVKVPAVRSNNDASGGGSTDDIRPPRWHSFLPGMFR